MIDLTRTYLHPDPQSGAALDDPMSLANIIAVFLIVFTLMGGVGWLLPGAAHADAEQSAQTQLVQTPRGKLIRKHWLDLDQPPCMIMVWTEATTGRVMFRNKHC